jgi:hypothetical protein
MEVGFLHTHESAMQSCSLLQGEYASNPAQHFLSPLVLIASPSLAQTVVVLQSAGQLHSFSPGPQISFPHLAQIPAPLLVAMHLLSSLIAEFGIFFNPEQQAGVPK